MFLHHLRARTRPCTLTQVRLPLNETQRCCQVFCEEFRAPVSFPDSALPSSLSPPLFLKPYSWCTKSHLFSKANLWHSTFVLFLFVWFKFLLYRFLRLPCGTPGESEAQLFLCVRLGWRDVVTVECCMACQWRHTGWMEWSNRDEENRWRGKMTAPCVHSFTLVGSTYGILNNDHMLHLFMQIQHTNIRRLIKNTDSLIEPNSTQVQKTGHQQYRISNHQIRTLKSQWVQNTLTMSPRRRSILEHNSKFNKRAWRAVCTCCFKSANYYPAHWPMTGENSAGPMTKILHSLFFILTFSFLLSVAFGLGPCSHMWWKVKKKKEREITGHTRMLTEARAVRGQVDTYLSLLWLLAGRVAVGGLEVEEEGGAHWTRAAVGVSVRWEFLLPPSLLQPRVSPMGWNGIKYACSQKHVVFSSWHPSIDPVLPTSAEKKSRVVLSLCPQQKEEEWKNSKVNPRCFGREAGGEVWEILSVLSSGCPDAGLRNTFPICALLLTRVESRREGATRAGQRRRESLWVTVK